MNSLFTFLSALNQQGIRLWIANNQLRINAPQGVLTPALTTELKTRKAEIIAFLQQNQAVSKSASIQPAPRNESLPLSFAQRRLWFLEQLGSGATYTIPATFKLQGPLNVPALEQTLTEIVRRHESLRTTFTQDIGETRQVIHAPTPVALPVIDLQQLPAAAQAAEVQRLARQETLRPFDLSSDLMLRATLLRLDGANALVGHGVGVNGYGATAKPHTAQEHVLLLTLHHIAADGWSMGVLTRELAALYAAFAQGKSSPLTALPIQYADFALWQRNWLQGEILEQQLTYWKSQLAGAPELLQLPTDFPRPQVQTFLANKLDFQIDAGLTQQLHQLSQRAGTTLFMTLLAAFQLLLARYSGQDDIVVDSPIANRNQQAVEPLIGLFVNDLALRTDLSGNPTFLELLTQVRQTTQRAYEHQDLPFDQLVEVLQPQRNLRYNPVTQVFFALQNAPMAEFELPSLQAQSLALEVQQTRMDLEVHLWERSDGLSGSWLYNTDLFAAATIARMVGHFQTLLAGIVADPGQRIAELPLLTAAEQQQILVEWASTSSATESSGAEPTEGQCLHHLFEAQAERTPDAVAVIFAGAQSQSLTYRELNARANQLAHFLQAQGVGPETFVGICVERSLAMMVGMLGILKAGGAYVPLDPAYPADRISFILKETQMPILLTQAHLLADLPTHAARVIALDRDWSTIAAHPTSNPNSSVAPHNLAYVIYTSGSTGNPKGVMVEQGSLATHIQTTSQHYQITAVDRILQFASFSFDVSLEQIFLALCNGATLVLRENELWTNDKFDWHILTHGVTVADLPPAYLHQLLHHWQTDLPSFFNGQLRLLVVGGEKITPETVTLWQQLRIRATRLLNAYGPTEATITATCFDLSAYPVDAKFTNLPIGKPLPNRQLYLLDVHHQPVPIGVWGDLYIGGGQLARGYLNRPALTAERFMQHPQFGRLYKTNDLCRWLPDGNLEYKGRTDFQVKLRGFRIELEEIEAQLKRHSGVSNAVVTLDTQSNPSLIAYLELKNALQIGENEYRIYTCAQKPELQAAMEAVHLAVWPRFFMGDAINAQYWRQLYRAFPAYQIALVNAHQVVAACNAIPLYWDGTPETIPSGWDDAVLKGFHHQQAGISPNTLCILAGSVSESHQSQGVSYELIKIMKALAYELDGIAHVIAPVRPSHKSRYPDLNFEAYCEQKREDGYRVDPWLRVHERLGGTLLNFSPRSQYIQGTIEEWELWTGQSIGQSGDYLFEGCMQPVKIDVEQNCGIYYDLAVWMTHTLESSLSCHLVDLLPEALRTGLRVSLPDYMIPTTFVFLDTMPLTPNGKVDRKALPDPSRLYLRDETTYLAPRTAMEHTLVAIWEEVLKRTAISVHDNFFDVGGHSLLAMEVHSRLRPTYPTLQIVDLFSYPTIHTLAGYIEQNNHGTVRQQSTADRGAKRRAQQAARQQQRQSVRA